MRRYRRWLIPAAAKSRSRWTCWEPTATAWTVADRTQRGSIRRRLGQQEQPSPDSGARSLADVVLAVNGPAQSPNWASRRNLPGGRPTRRPRSRRRAGRDGTAPTDAAGTGTVEVGPAGGAGMSLGGIGLIGVAFAAGGSTAMNTTGQKGDSPVCRSTLRAVPANGDCPFSAFGTISRPWTARNPSRASISRWLRPGPTMPPVGSCSAVWP